MAAQQNKINMGKSFIPLQGMVSCLLFFLFPGLILIVAKSADETAILLLGLYVDVVRKCVLCYFMHVGILSHTEKVPNELISPNWLCLGRVPL